jgi:hypothetical protein
MQHNQTVGGANVRLSVESPHREALRDYFLRLGCDAHVDGAGALQVAQPRDAAEEDAIGRFLERWVAANGVAVGPAPAPGAEPAPPAAAPSSPVSVFARAGNGSPPLRVGDLLASKGLITQEQLAHALQESRATGELVGQVLLRKRWVFEDELARTLAQQWSLPYLNLMAVGVDWGAARLLPAKVGLEAAAIPVRFQGSSVLVAFADPSDDAAIAAVTPYVESPALAVAELTHIEMLWRRVAA